MTADKSPPSTVASARPRPPAAANADENGAQWSWMTAAEIAQRCAWVAFPIAGMLWVATRYSHNWYVADEWLLFARMTGSKSWMSSAFAGTYGHLMVPTHAVYWLQKTRRGVEGHELVWLVFCASLGALQLSIAAVLRRLGLPTLIALLAATIVTFFGPGAQDMVWQFQLGVNFALALCFAAAFVALGDSTSRGAAVAIASLLVLAVGFDSGLAVFGTAYVGVVLVFLRPRRFVVAALGPPAVAHLAWFAFGSGATYPPLSLGDMASFAWHLFTLAAGGLVGGGGTKRAFGNAVGGSPHPANTIPLSGEAVGIIALVLASLCVAFGFARHRQSRKVVASLAGGLVAAVVAVAFLAKTRAFIRPVMLPLSGARFIQWIAIFLLLAFAPAITAALRPASRLWRSWGAIAAAAALVAVFVLNLGQLRPVREFQEVWETNIKSDVRQTITVLSEGCGAGRRPNPSAGFKNDSFLGVLRVGVVQDLLANGDLTPGFGIRAKPEVREAVCKPATSFAGAANGAMVP